MAKHDENDNVTPNDADAETRPLSVNVGDKEFRRPNKVVGVRVDKGGSLTLLSRKIFNVILYHTQKMKMPGSEVVARMEGLTPAEIITYQKFYWLPLNTFVDDVKFDSNAIEYLQNSLQNLKDVNLHLEDKNSIGSASLLAEYKIRSRSNKRGEQRYVGWALAPSVEAMAMNPDLYTTASLYYLTALKTTAGLGLYEIAKRYANSPGGLTMRKPVAWWFEHLKGVPVGTDMPEYKIFKRDTLKEAMKEVKGLTDVEVELIEHKNGRKVGELQFKVTSKKQADLNLPTPPIIDPGLIERIEKFGLSKHEAEDITVTNSPEMIVKALDWMDARVSDVNLPPVRYEAAFFRNALEGRYAETEEKAKKARAKKKADDTPALIEVKKDPEAEAARNAALAAFDTLDENRSAKVLIEIANRHQLLYKMLAKSPKAKSTRLSLAGFLLENPDLLGV